MHTLIPLPQTHLFYGGDYNPEQWCIEDWHEDVRLMKEAGVNLATIGVFSWAHLEPQPGVYDFEWFDNVVNLLHKNGIEICLATATASPPPWLAKHHPESLPVNADGVKYFPGGRQAYCLHSEAYKKYASALVRLMAERYGDHPAVKIWHINNEYGCHTSECFCDVCADAFRTWLKQKYATIEALNHAWGTAFWSQHYGDWDEINPPRRAPTFANPTQQLDWRRFSSDSMLDLMNMEKAILRELTPHIPVTTNFLGFWKSTDYWNFSQHEDVISMDAYPEPSTPLISSAQFAMQCDFMRSAADNRPWILMEQTPSAVNWRQQNAPKAPGLMRLWSLSSVIRGAGAVMFFQWRQSKAGAEKFHSAMVPHAHPAKSRIWDEITRLGGELKRLSPILKSKVKAESAIMLDWESWWALEIDSKPSMRLKQDEIQALHFGPLFCSGITSDFVHPGSDLSSYKLVVIPNLYQVTAQHAENIVRYVENGGTLVMSFFSGIADENDHIWVGGYPALFKKMLGIMVEEFAPAVSDEKFSVRFNDGNETQTDLWSEVIHLEGAESLAHFTDGFCDGKPAITKHRFGKGTAYYIGTRLSLDDMVKVFAPIIATANVSPVLPAPLGVDVVLREGEHSFLCIMNNLQESITLDLQKYAGVDLLTGECCEKSVSVDKFGVKIIQL